MTIQEKFGKAIIRLRKHFGLSQEQFAYDSNIDRRYLSDLENGKRNVSISVIERISNSLGIEASTLLYEAEHEGQGAISEIKEILKERGSHDAILFGDPSFSQAIIGISGEGRVVYSYEKMIDCLKISHSLSNEEAVEFIGQYTLRDLPLMGEKRPIIMFSIGKK